MKDRLNKISVLYSEHQMAEAEALIEELLQTDEKNDELYFWLGKVFYRKQEWGKAINAFNKVLELNPEHPDAQSQIDMANNILGYFTPDMFNP